MIQQQIRGENNLFSSCVFAARFLFQPRMRKNGWEGVTCYINEKRSVVLCCFVLQANYSIVRGKKKLKGLVSSALIDAFWES